MSITVSNIQDLLNSHIGDSSTDRVTANDRLRAISESVIWLQEKLENDLQNATYELNYLDTINYYKVTTAIADLLEAADLRREKDLHTLSFTYKSPRELAEEIGQGSGESSYSIERRDGDSFLVVNHGSENTAKVVADFDALTAGGGTWATDSTNSDATNLTVDTVEKEQGNASLNFDIDISQSGNNKATIQNTTLTSMDLSDYEDLASWIFEIYIPDVTYFSSVTLYWGSSSTSYWSATATTDIDGSAFADGWNKVKINWADATETSSPDESAIDFISFDFNYTASQGDDTDYRIDYLRLAVPEKLTFHYLSWYVGTNTGGTDILTFGATTDIPYFSGQYDNYIYPAAHKASAIVFKQLRLYDDANIQEVDAERALRRAMKIHPSSKVEEIKSFKVSGISFNRKITR